jgi:hypothetical protein
MPARRRDGNPLLAIPKNDVAGLDIEATARAQEWLG